MQHDAWFFIGVFVFIFLIWIATGGPLHPISFAGPFLSQPSPLGSGSYIGLPKAPFAIGNSTSGSSGSSGGGSYSGGGALSGVPFGTPSPYRGELSLSGYVSDAGANDPEQEYVRITLDQNAPGPVTLSGFALTSAATGNTAIIPKGTDLPYSGTVQALQPIVLNPGDSAVVDSGESPIGASFRENECIGYFADFQKFYPQLPNSCPTPNSELHTYYPSYIRDLACLNYVDTLPSCTLEVSPPPGLTSACQSFLIDHLSYAGCVAGHQHDPGFEGTVYRVYLGRTAPLWRKSNEVVKLIDSNGDTVDAFSY